MTGTEYTNRRHKLISVHQHPIVLTAHASMQAKSDMAHKYVQEPSFFYFSGIAYEGWKLFFDTKEWLLVRPIVSSTHEIFDGSLSDDEALRISGVEKIISHEEFNRKLSTLSSSHFSIATIGPDPMRKYYDFIENPAQANLRRELKKHFKEVVDCRDAIKKIRARKTEVEIATLRRAVDMTVDAFMEVRKNLADYSHEYEVEAHFNAAFRSTGGHGHAYEPIVAAGKNACTLHYGANNDALPSNGLLLLDIGAQVDGYAADITRTFACGTPTKRQVEIHEAVEVAHQKIIALIKPRVLFSDYQKNVNEIMKDALESVGLLHDRNDQTTYRKYFPHAIGHGLGIDVHESLGGYKEFKPGMILTVEPGIYIPEEGIGVRIEDDILVTETGNENLSAKLPTSL